MSTLIELDAAGALVRLDPDLDADQLEQRCIYVLPHVIRQIERLMDKASPRGLAETPVEQLNDLVAHFAMGGELDMPRHFHIMRPRGDSVWELKTADVRLMGWFAAKDVFICTSVLDAQLVKGTEDSRVASGNLYSGLCAEAVRYRNELDLDPPKFVPGEHPEDVVSNYTCS